MAMIRDVVRGLELIEKYEPGAQVEIMRCALTCGTIGASAPKMTSDERAEMARLGWYQRGYLHEWWF